MSKSFSKWLLALMLLFVLVLAACSGGDDSEEGTGDTDTDAKTEEEATEEESGSEDGIYSIDDFSPDKTDEGEAIDGRDLNFGLVSDTVFEGVLNYNFYEGNPDAEVMKFFNESLLYYDNNFNYTQNGPAEWEIDEAGTT